MQYHDTNKMHLVHNLQMITNRSKYVALRVDSIK